MPINHLLNPGKIPVSCVTFKGGRCRVGKHCYKEWKANAVSRVCFAFDLLPAILLLCPDIKKNHKWPGYKTARSKSEIPTVSTL